MVTALTALKSGEPPTTAILLSTDMFTLIDEDAIVPFDDLVKGPEDHAWMKSFFPAFMKNSQTGGKTWEHPLPRPPVVPLLNQGDVQGGGPDPDTPPPHRA